MARTSSKVRSIGRALKMVGLVILALVLIAYFPGAVFGLAKLIVGFAQFAVRTVIGCVLIAIALVVLAAK